MTPEEFTIHYLAKSLARREADIEHLENQVMRLQQALQEARKPAVPGTDEKTREVSDYRKRTEG